MILSDTCATFRDHAVEILSSRTITYAALPNLTSAHERDLRILKRQRGSPPPAAWPSEPIIRKLNQSAFATADTPSVQERLNAVEIATSIIALGACRGAAGPALRTKIKTLLGDRTARVSRAFQTDPIDRASQVCFRI